MKSSLVLLLSVLIISFLGCSKPEDPLEFQSSRIIDGQTVTGIFFNSGNNGFAVTESGMILRTTDGGKTFVQSGSSNGRRLEDVYFLDDEIGFAYGSHGALLRTTDEGMTWNALSVDTIIDLTGVGFAHDDMGVAAGNINAGEEAGTGVIGRSTDQGLTWKFDRTDFQDLQGVDIVPETHAWILATGALVYTTDGGQTWENVASQATGANSVFFTDVQHGWQVGDSGMLKYSTDGGWSWQNKLKMTDESLRCVAAPEVDRIYIAGNRFIAASTDHGHRWTMDTLSHRLDFIDIGFADKRVYIAAKSGELISFRF